MGAKIKQYDVFWVNLDPTEGSEMAKKRPCVIISPNEMNDCLNTVTIAPLTSNLMPIFWRVKVFFNKQNGIIALDHIRSVSKSRLNKRMGHLQTSEIQAVKQTIKEIFVD